MDPILTCVYSVWYINHLAPKSDEHLISPYNIPTQSHIDVMRMKEIITN